MTTDGKKNLIDQLERVTLDFADVMAEARQRARSATKLLGEAQAMRDAAQADLAAVSPEALVPTVTRLVAVLGSILGVGDNATVSIGCIPYEKWNIVRGLFGDAAKVRASFHRETSVHTNYRRYAIDSFSVRLAGGEVYAQAYPCRDLTPEELASVEEAERERAQRRGDAAHV